MCCCARLEVCESCSPCRYVFRTNANLTCVCLSKTLVPVFDLCHRQAPLAQKLSQACCWTSLGLLCVVGPILGGVFCGLLCSSIGVLIIVVSFNYFPRGDGVCSLTFWFANVIGPTWRLHSYVLCSVQLLVTYTIFVFLLHRFHSTINVK